ncbi:MAG: PLP-dependent transferase, partial [Candidatus Heimdallarchaeota archaeon]|nr:PLP-dependent transferase [Candidatus Heimdallarchaeota archaeon]
MEIQKVDHSQGVENWIAEGKKLAADRKRRIKRAKGWKFDTIATHGLYDFRQASQFHSGSIMEPIYLSPAQAFSDYDEMEVALAYEMPSWIYTRIANPSTLYLEETISLLETYETDAEACTVVCASGMSAIRSAIEPFLIRDNSSPVPNF